MLNVFKLDHYRIIVSLSRYFLFIVLFIDRKQYLTYRNSTNMHYTVYTNGVINTRYTAVKYDYAHVLHIAQTLSI